MPDSDLRLPDELAETLARFDSSPDDITEAEPSFAIEAQLKDKEDATDFDRQAVSAEVAALQMHLVHGQKRSHWGTRFGSIIESIREDGTRSGFPDMTKVDNRVIAYLQRRSADVKHPVLKARYADFLWDVTKVATGNRASIDMARQAIDSYIECGTRFPDSERTSERLWRGLELALSVKDRERTEAVVDAMISVLDNSDFPGSHVIWVYDVLTVQQGIVLTRVQQDKIVDALESEMARICGADKPVGIAAKEPVIRLANYYRDEKLLEEVKRVLLTYGGALREFASRAGGMIGMCWLQDAYETYVEFGMKDDAGFLQIAAKEQGKVAEGEMVHHSVSIEIPKDEIEVFLEELTADDLESTLARISINFCPRKKDLEKQLDDIKKNAKLFSMLSQSTLDNQQVIARVGSIDDDPEGRIMQQMRQSIQFMAPILGAAIDCTRSKHGLTVDRMHEFLSMSPLFDESRQSIVDHAINAYLCDDHITTIHVLLPQIENALRRLLAVLGEPTNKHRRSDTGVMIEKSLNEILENETVVQRFFGDDTVLYLRMVLCDPRGMNLRNRVAHGLIAAEQFNRGVSDRLLHILWSLAFVRRRESGEGSSSATSP